MLKNVKVGFAICGSFCTIKEALVQLQKFVDAGADVVPIISNTVFNTDYTRFITKEELLSSIKKITGKEPISTIVDAEPIGPKHMTDIVVVAPCTGNTLAKLANGITDSAVIMAVKANLRNGNPVVLSIATNDALSTNLKNIGLLLNAKNYYFVPFGQDDPEHKKTSMVADFDLILPTTISALEGKQIQPVLIERK